MFYVYLLQSNKNHSFYIGYSANLKRRLSEHNDGKNKATKPFIPYKLIYYEAFLDKTDAQHREIYLKSGYGRRSIQKMMKNFFMKNTSNQGRGGHL